MCYTENLLSVYRAVASFAILAQPVVAQGATTTLPLTYPARVLHRDNSQTCPSEEQEEILRNEIDNETLSLLRESVILHLQNFSCGGFAWRCVVYLYVRPLSAVSFCVAGDHHPISSVWKQIF